MWLFKFRQHTIDSIRDTLRALDHSWHVFAFDVAWQMLRQALLSSRVLQAGKRRSIICIQRFRQRITEAIVPPLAEPFVKEPSDATLTSYPSALLFDAFSRTATIFLDIKSDGIESKPLSV